MISKIDKATDEVWMGIRLAIALEINAIRLYSAKQKMIHNAVLRDLLGFMVGQEEEHKKLLEELQNSLEDKGKYINIPKKFLGEIMNPHQFFKKNILPKIRKNDQEIRLLLAIMRAEMDAEDVYLKISKKTKDSTGKQFFIDLAKFEKSHYELVNALYESSNYVKVES